MFKIYLLFLKYLFLKTHMCRIASSAEGELNELSWASHPSLCHQGHSSFHSTQKVELRKELQI